jgi:hypothetical protein
VKKSGRSVGQEYLQSFGNAAFIPTCPLDLKQFFHSFRGMEGFERVFTGK